ncbi:hypothetical protein MtrunA17_Chr4g0029531 [Medicago truncatula]|uniref:Uncharacterized protein n=1 Tax=Medicago truncatula TaxID=3880 RepID=G7JPG2_MEDTR|nr:hypothetical protein MTR_4g059890 [Medicago truncatula]RHN60777.1 hypothetical protein MtrunA17_Chr4g0029531 [Medicago truncatula]
MDQVTAQDLEVNLCVMDKDKTLYQDQGQALWKSMLCGSSLWTKILCTKCLT